MSEYINQPPQSPIQSPQMQPQVTTASAGMPKFAKGFIITDVVFCSLRGVIGLLAIISLFVLKDKFVLVLGCTEVVSNLGIFTFGLLANILLLQNKISGVKISYVNIGFTVMNIITGCIGVVYKASQYTETAKMIGAATGGTLAIIARIVLLICYIIAIKQASDYFSAKKQAEYPQQY
jgi:hypothetical protein